MTKYLVLLQKSFFSLQINRHINFIWDTRALRVHRQVFFSPFQSNIERGRFKQSRKAPVYRAATPKKKKKKKDVFWRVCVEIDFLKSDSHHAEEERKNAPIHIQEY